MSTHSKQQTDRDNGSAVRDLEAMGNTQSADTHGQTFSGIGDGAGSKYPLTPELAAIGKELLNFHRRAKGVLDIIYHHGLLEGDVHDRRCVEATLDLLREAAQALNTEGFDMPAPWMYKETAALEIEQ